MGHGAVTDALARALGATLAATTDGERVCLLKLPLLLGNRGTTSSSAAA